MRKFVVLFAVALLSGSLMAAENKEAKPVAATDDWNFIEIGFFYGTPSTTVNSQVYGVKVGAPIAAGYGRVCGVEAAVLVAGTDNIYGLQCSIITAMSKNLNGLQFSIVNFGEEVNGLQLGVVNIAKGKTCQLGIVNYIEGGLIPVMPVFNMKL